MVRSELIKIWPFEGIETVLDLGCRDCWHTAGLPGVKRHIGVEIWEPALQRGIEKAKFGGIPGFEPVQEDAFMYLVSTPTDGFDAVLAIDLLEHFKPKRGLMLLDQITRVAKKFAVVWTTLGYITQGPVDIDGNENPYEEHLWGPSREIFEQRDWLFREYPKWHQDRGGAILAWQLK